MSLSDQSAMGSIDLASLPPPAFETKRLKYSIRHGKFLEMDTMSRILMNAFWNEDAMGRFIHPKREQYPSDVRRWWRNKLLVSLSNWQEEILVAVDPEMKHIVGVAVWSRQGPRVKELKGKGWKWNLRFLIEPIIKAKVSLSNTIHPNRAVGDASTLTAFSRAVPFMQHFWNPPRDDCWELTHLGVDPSQQGKGIGRALVAWGLARADEENATASVVSAAGKENFYQRCGFLTRAGNVTEGEGNPLAGVQGGDIFFKDKTLLV